MTKDLKPGDKVRWETSQGRTEGTVQRKITGTTKVKGYTAKATRGSPEFLVKTTRSGKAAVHKPGALKKV